MKKDEQLDKEVILRGKKGLIVFPYPQLKLWASLNYNLSFGG